MVWDIISDAEFERKLQCDVSKDETLTRELGKIPYVIREPTFLVCMTHDLSKNKSMKRKKREKEREKKSGFDHVNVK